MGSLGFQTTITTINNGTLTKNHSNGLQGHVKFNFEVTHPRFGKIPIRNEFPRLKPGFELDNKLDEKDMEILLQKILNWSQFYWKIPHEKEDYFKNIAENSIILSIYTNPYVKLYSKQMELNVRIMFWLWILDDEIENAIDNGILPGSLKAGTDQYINILANKNILKLPEFKQVSNYTFFQPLFNSLLDLHKEFSNHIPHYYQRNKHLQFVIRRFFEAQTWFSNDSIDGRYSEGTMKQFRAIDGGLDIYLEMSMLILNVSLPKEIRRHPIYIRMVEIACTNGGLLNDVLGLKKEFLSHHKNTTNLVVFKVLKQNMPLDIAVSEICDFIKAELNDFVLLKKVILQEFSNHPELISCINIMESILDGHLYLYPMSKRYKNSSVHCITLTR